jgi:multidrug efflux pump subunit AcrA (membrane-fusion protein)
MRKTSRWFVPLCLLVLAGCGKKEEKEAEAVVPVQVTAVRQDSIRRIVTADAVLYPYNQASVTPKISAPVKKFHVNRGDHVKEGQVLAVLENRDLSAAARESKGLYEQAAANYRATSSASLPVQVTTAQSNLQAAKEALDAAKKLLDSREQLFKENALARRQVDEAQVAYVQARSQFETAQEQLKTLQSVGKEEQMKAAKAQADASEAHYNGAEAQLAYTEIRSPITGVITDRPIWEGEMASAGAPLLTVMDVSRVVARANIPLEQAAPLKVGDDAAITPSDGSDAVQGKVIVVSPAVDSNTTTVQVWVEVVNPKERLKPGASVRVAIVAAKVPSAIVVPPAALLPTAEGETVVMVVGSDSLAHEKKVEIGIREPDKVQIVSGVSVGEQVIIQGGLGLEDKAKVTIKKPGEEPADDKGAGKDEK